MKHRLLPLLLALVLALGCLSPALALEPPMTQFTDVAPDAWYAPYVDICVEDGLMEGVGDEKFAPEETLSSMECSVLALRLYDLLHGGDGEFDPAPEDWGYATLTSSDGQTVQGYIEDKDIWDWSRFSRVGESFLCFDLETEKEQAWGKAMDYQTATLSMNGMDCAGELHLMSDYLLYFSPVSGSWDSFHAIRDNSYPTPEDWYRDAWYYADQRELRALLKYGDSRRDFARAVAAAAGELEPINDISGLPDASDAGVLALCRAGVLTGSDEYGTFRPDDTLTRAEATAILSRVLRPELRQSYTLKPLETYADFTLTYLCDDRPEGRDYWPRPYNSPWLLGLDDHTVLTLDGELIPLPEGYELRSPNPFPVQLQPDCVAVGRYEEGWKAWRSYRWDLKDGIFPLTEEEEDGIWDNPHGNEAYNDGRLSNERPICNADGQPITPCFDWAGVLDDQGCGFVALAGKVYRIQFTQ